MTPIPDVRPLPQGHRKLIFILALTLFACMVPILVFYATGYRFDFSNENQSIVSVGGIYVSAEADNILIYVDDEPVEDVRIFQNAAYIQNLDAGMHQVHTQTDGVQTWVKELPVFAHFVTEVNSFNIPQAPQVRLVGQYHTLSGETVLFDETATSSKFGFASTSNSFFVATSTATSTYEQGVEYIYVQQQIASSTEKKEVIAAEKTRNNKQFAFHTDMPKIGPRMATSTKPIATSTKEWNNVRLFESGGDVYAQWIGKIEKTPYYFCVSSTDASSTAMYYGTHVYTSFVEEYGTSTDPFLKAHTVAGQYCRSTIKIDRLWQSVQWFDFFPGSSDHVIMHLQDGIYVVEIDDRAWQNVQLLYPGHHLEVILDNNTVYIKDDQYYLQVFTELQ